MQVQHVATELIVKDARPTGRTTVLELSWWSSDPLAVTITMISRPDHPALPRGAWVVLRDVLRAGLRGPAGDGEIHLAPTRSAAVTDEDEVAPADEAAAAEDWWRHTDSSSPERLAILRQHSYHEPLTTSQGWSPTVITRS